MSRYLINFSCNNVKAVMLKFFYYIEFGFKVQWSEGVTTVILSIRFREDDSRHIPIRLIN